jgi:hypothetical protein
MEDVIAARVRMADGEEIWIMTWGRIQGAVAYEPTEAAIAEGMRVVTGGEPADVACATLREARERAYFFEALVSFGQQPIPFGPHYEAWRAEKDAAMRAGGELYILERGR